MYACEDHAIVQHEAFHAFCAQTFGGLGPVWYAEGMAEMGQLLAAGYSTRKHRPGGGELSEELVGAQADQYRRRGADHG